MEVDPIELVLAVLARTYCGLDAIEAEAVAKKVVELAKSTPEVEGVVDMLDLFDDVWAASLLAGTITEKDGTQPIHPLTYRESLANFAKNEHEREEVLSHPDEFYEPNPVKKPKRYKDKRYVAAKPQRVKKRHNWDKGGE